MRARIRRARPAKQRSARRRPRNERPASEHSTKARSRRRSFANRRSSNPRRDRDRSANERSAPEGSDAERSACANRSRGGLERDVDRASASFQGLVLAHKRRNRCAARTRCAPKLAGTSHVSPGEIFQSREPEPSLALEIVPLPASAMYARATSSVSRSIVRSASISMSSTANSQSASGARDVPRSID